MEDKELGAMQECVRRLDKEVFGNGKKGLAETVHRMDGKIDTLITTVGDLRTVTSGLIQFQASYTGAENQRGKSLGNSLKIIGTIIAFIAIMLTIVGMNKRTEDKVKDIVDQYGYDVTMRSGEFVPWDTLRTD